MFLCAIGLGPFTYHDVTPDISDSPYNVVTDSGGIDVSRYRYKEQLVKAHGILMLIAWLLLASTAIFFAMWMKPALPNGEWFQV